MELPDRHVPGPGRGHAVHDPLPAGAGRHTEEAATWAGLINGISLAIFALMNVIWGAAADRWGLKTGLVRSLWFAAVGLAVLRLAFVWAVRVDAGHLVPAAQPGS